MYLITTVTQRLVHEFARLCIEVQFEIAVLYCCTLCGAQAMRTGIDRFGFATCLPDEFSNH